MDAIKNRSDLLSIKKEHLRRQKSYRRQVLVCGGTGCISSSCGEVRDALIKSMSTYKLDGEVKVMATGYMGTHAMGPAILVEPEGIFYTRMNPEKAESMVARHLLKDEVYEEYTYFDEDEGVHVPRMGDIPLLKGQVRMALKNCGHMEYVFLEAYISRDGYGALARTSSEMTPAQVVKEMKAAGLRGHGGAGSPIGMKWGADMKAVSEGGRKFMVCNADERDPGVFMDRSILEGDLHSITEGMMLGGYAIGTSKGYIYVRAEYLIVMERLGNAIDQARKVGILGENVMGSSFPFDLEIRINAGALVCDEETSLLVSIEGKKEGPRQKPPSPFKKGLFESPTVISNVETPANTAPIILNGLQWYGGLGTEKGVGIKVFALTGDIVNAGIIEISMGTILGDIIYKVGGRIIGGEKFKVIQPGDPSGGCLTRTYLDTPVGYESLSSLGAIMDSGGLIIMNENICMVDTARYFMNFICDESYGKRPPCHNGTRRMLEVLERITEGKEQPKDLEFLEEPAGTIQQTAMRGLGQTAPNPVLSILEYFHSEYEVHIYEKYCSVGVYAELQTSPCRNACPVSILIPGYISLLAAGRTEGMYHPTRQDNSLPAVRGCVCTYPCESHCRCAQVGEPLTICNVKRSIGDYALRDEYNVPLVEPRPAVGKRISVIGVGPSGPACAYYLANTGHEVYVYGSEPVAGGALYWDTPEYRLPKAMLQKEIHATERSDVQIHLDARIGPNIAFEDMKKQSDTIYIASGTQVSRLLDVPGEDPEGVESGFGLLKHIGPKKDMSVPNKLVVIGGDSMVMDMAETAVRLGTSEVTVTYRRSEKEMPAGEDEIIGARKEGVKLIAMASPVEFLGADGEVTGIHLIRRRETDYGSNGRRRTAHISDSNFFLECDDIVTTINQDVGYQVYRTTHVEVAKSGKLDISRFTPETGEPGAFTGGDVSPWGANVVTHATAGDKEATIKIGQYPGGKDELNMGEWLDIPEIAGTEANESHKCFPTRCLSIEERKDNFREVNRGLHKLDAMGEALRCLHCDRR